MTDYPIRRSDRARRARINVSAEGVEVVVPRRMALRHVTPFVEEKRPWIERTLRRMREAEEAAGGGPGGGGAAVRRGVGALSGPEPPARHPCAANSCPPPRGSTPRLAPCLRRLVRA